MLLLPSSSPYFFHSYCYFYTSCFPYYTLFPYCSCSSCLCTKLLYTKVCCQKCCCTSQQQQQHTHTTHSHTQHTHLTYTQHTHLSYTHTDTLAAAIEHFVSHFLMRLISFFSCFFYSAPCNFFPSASSCLALFHFCANSMKNFSIMYTNTNTNTCAQSTYSPHI